MKVTFVCKYLAKGGAERVMSTLINYFCAHHIEVQLIMLHENLIEYEIPSTVKVDYLDSSGCKSVIKRTKKLIELRKLIEGDYVITFLYGAIRDTVFATLGSTRKIIVSDRNDPSKDPAKKLAKLLRTLSYELSDCIVFQTPDAQKYFSRSIQKKSLIIPNPLRADLPEPYTGEREKIIIAAGRLEEQKNFPMLIRAFAEFHRCYPEYILKIYGRGTLENNLKELAEQLNIREYIVFPGFVNDINERMNTAAMYVSSSDYEGISNSMLEALAMGVPTICTDCPVGGARMTIQDGVNGLLVPVGEEMPLYRAMKRIVEKPEETRMLSKNAIRIRRKLAADAICERWVQLLN